MTAFAPTATCDSPNWSVQLTELLRPQPALISSFVPISQRAALLAEFSETISECSSPGWSGEHSDPIGLEATAAAKKLISHLPADLASPSVGAIPEGLISFEWYQNPKRLVLVVPNTRNAIDYVVRRGDEILHGSAPFFGKLPDTVLTQIRALK